MARYRFAWTNLPLGLTNELARGLAVDGDPLVGLQKRYGARPKTAFIQQAWPILLKYWLPNDTVSREFLTDELRALGLGRVEINIREEQGQLAYLASCRNATTPRAVALSAFIVTGEPQLRLPPIKVVPESLTEPPPGEAGRGIANRCKPGQSDDAWIDGLNNWIVRTLEEALGSEVSRDADGDIPIRRGSTVLFIRPHDGKSPFLEIFAPLLSDFRHEPAVFEAVNSLNIHVPFAKAFVTADGTRIILQAQLLTHSISAADFLFTVDLVSDAADHYDTLLQKRFGVHTFVADVVERVNVYKGNCENPGTPAVSPVR